MTELIACLSTGKGTWAHVSKLIENEWDKVFLVTNDFGLKFDMRGKGEFVVTDFNKGIYSVIEDIVKQLNAP